MVASTITKKRGEREKPAPKDMSVVERQNPAEDCMKNKPGDLCLPPVSTTLMLLLLMWLAKKPNKKNPKNKKRVMKTWLGRN